MLHLSFDIGWLVLVGVGWCWFVDVCGCLWMKHGTYLAGRPPFLGGVGTCATESYDQADPSGLETHRLDLYQYLAQPPWAEAPSPAAF